MSAGARGDDMRFVEPVTLDGRHATLEPLAREHEAACAAAAADGELWRLWYTSVPAPDRTVPGWTPRSRCARTWARCRS